MVFTVILESLCTLLLQLLYSATGNMNDDGVGITFPLNYHQDSKFRSAGTTNSSWLLENHVLISEIPGT